MFQNDWKECVRRTRESRLVLNGVPLSEHFFLGFAPATRDQAVHPLNVVGAFDLPDKSPVFIHESSFDGHMNIVGPTGLNKSMVAVLGILLQVIAGRIELDRDCDGKVFVGLDGEPLWKATDPEPIVVIDLKGDIALKNAAEEAAKKRGQTFRAFTLEPKKATSFFNALDNLYYTHQPVIELCELTLNGLDLFHGEFSYGTGYFSEMCRHLLLMTLRTSKKRPTSWDELYELLIDTLDKRQHKDVFELIGRIYALASYPVLGPAPSGIDAIHMPQVVAKNECVYFYLPALGSAMSVIAIAKLAILAFLRAGRAWNDSGKKTKKLWLFIDEAQMVIGKNAQTFFQQSSGSKVRLVTSLQSLATLDSRDAPNLSGSIRTNSRVRQALGLLDIGEREDWIKSSGEKLGYIRSFQQGIDGQGRSTSGSTTQEVIHPRLNHDVMNAVANTPGASLLSVVRDAGITAYKGISLPIWCPYPILFAEYQRLASTPWPDQPVTKAAAGVTQTTVVNQQSPHAIEAAAAHKYASIENLFTDVSKRSGRRSSPSAE